MGGYGSGRRHETAKLDEGLKLDINQMKREGSIALGVKGSGSMTWTYSHNGEKRAAISYKVDTIDPNNMWMRLIYTFTSYWSEEQEDIEYKIRLETTEPNYGGKRLWFICPSTGRRAGKLYKPCGGRYFASRHAFRLKYVSQSKSARGRAIDNMWKMRGKLNDDGNYWLKPKGMHWNTFHDLCDEIEAAEAVCCGYMMELVHNLHGSMGGLK